METRYPDSKNKNSVEDGLRFADSCCIALYTRGLLIHPFQSKYYQYQVGESIQGIEFKYDSWIPQSHRLSIETEERKTKDNPWVQSGIYRNDNTWLYVQGSLQKAWAFSITMLRLLHKTERYEEHEESTVKAFYLSETNADKYCDFFFHPDSKEN